VFRHRGFTLVELMIVVAIVGILAALAIPNFIRFQARSKQAEAKSNLKAIYTGQRAFHADRDAYATNIADVSFDPERGNRYLYELLAGCTNEETRDVTVPVYNARIACRVSADILQHGPAFTTARLGDLTGAGAVTFRPSAAIGLAPFTGGAGVYGACPACAFVARAAGQVDNDEGDDQFFVSSEFTAVAAAPCAEQNEVAGSQPVNNRNDVNCE
jgi:type IV pilus assembly protein PilA